MSKVVRFFMFVTLACVTFSCGKDEEPLPPLSLAYIELESAADATQLLPGDAGSKTFSVAASRKFAANADVDWCSAAVDVEAQTITLTVTRNAYVTGTKPSKRNGVVTITALPEREGDDVSNIKLDVNVEQALYGLPEADMLNLVFNATGALDTSPLSNIINTPQEVPTTKMNTVYNRFSAVFSGNRASGHAGTMFYQIPLYTTTLTWDQLTVFGVDRNALPNPTLTALGQAFDHKNFTVEGIISNTFKNAAGEDLYGEQEFISIQQSAGWGLGFEGGNAENGGTFVFYYNWCDKLLEYDAATKSDGNYKFGIEPAVEGQPVVGARPNVFYHVVVTTDFTAHKIIAYVDGKLIGERAFNETTTTVTLPCGANKFANWIGLGADPNNPPTRGEGVTELPKATSQYSANGELVVARMYNKALTATEVELLYQYEKP
jgi:hypothetical protein